MAETSEIFMRQIHALNNHPTCSNLFKKFCQKNINELDWCSLLSVASNALLEPQYTAVVGSHLRPWLSELLPRLASHPTLNRRQNQKAKNNQSLSSDEVKCENSAGTGNGETENKFSDSNVKQQNKRQSTSDCRDLSTESASSTDPCYNKSYLRMHQAICVAVAALLPIAPHPVLQFALQYFEQHPPPYASNNESCVEPNNKKRRLSDNSTLPQYSQQQILEVTYELVLATGDQLSHVWSWGDILSFTSAQHSQHIRWLACECIGLLSHMTEKERAELTRKHVTSDEARKLSVVYSTARHSRETEQCSVWRRDDHLTGKLSRNNSDKAHQPSVNSSSSDDSFSVKKAKRERKSRMITNGATIPDEEDQEEAALIPAMPLKFTSWVGKNLLPLCDAKHKGGDSSGRLLVPVASTRSNMERVWCGVVSCRPVLLEGPVGCGKTAIVEHMAHVTGRSSAPFLTKVQLGEQTDSKSLLGTYRCTATPGEFVWSPGAVTRAVTAGHWLLLEDVDAAQLDVVAVIASLVEDRVLMVPGTGAVPAHRNFRLFATRRLSAQGTRTSSAGTTSACSKLEPLWCKVLLHSLSCEEMIHVLKTRFGETSRLRNSAERLVSVYTSLAPGQHPHTFDDNMQPSHLPAFSSTAATAAIKASTVVSSTTASGRLVCFRDLLKWADRIAAREQLNDHELPMAAFQEALDCFCAAVPEPITRDLFAEQIAGYLNLSATVATQQCHDYKPEISITNHCVRISERALLHKLPSPLPSLMASVAVKSPFSFTRKSCVLLERIVVAVNNKEPVLIVGETGTGKTTAVQYLAYQTNRKLKVINMNQQSDATDLLGGFKPVEMRTILFPLREEFEGLFAVTMSEKHKFLRHIMAEYGKKNWNRLLDLMIGSEKIAVQKLQKDIMQIKQQIKQNNAKLAETDAELQESKKRKRVELENFRDGKLCEKEKLKESQKEKERYLKSWTKLRIKLEQAKGHVDKSQSALAFSFIEGALSKAIVEGDWVLLDEINLANSETLECLSSLLESENGSLTLLERGDDRPIKRHRGFHLFACMNPATDVGKRELPPGLRNRFTEFYMEDLSKNDDLEILIADYLCQQDPTPRHIQGIRRLYCDVRERARNRGELVDTTGAAAHYTLRTLCRALSVASNNPAKNFSRSLYHAFSLSFLTQLDRPSLAVVKKLIIDHLFASKKNKGVEKSKNFYRDIERSLGKPLPHPANIMDTVDGGDVSHVPSGTVIGDYVMISGFWIAKGSKEPSTNIHYILTESVESNLRTVARVVSLGEGSPVLLQGDTSVGKTSLITYLAQKCGVPCIRINNHEHTDIQEYLGCYSPDETGKLIFREGALVTAMRRGDWIILDELNLAPTDVLEALNRLLDNNRELFLPETQETVRAHSNFRLFATQNPPGLYGGRKILSRAFRNRFVELHFDEIPGNELIHIIHERCSLSVQHSSKLVSVLEGLQMRRGKDNMFQGRQSLVTLRDLFRWAERYHLAQQPMDSGKFYDWEQHLADEGYLVLAGRVRNDEEADIIKTVIEEKMRCKIDPERLFKLNENTSPVTRPILEKLQQVTGFEHLVFTDDMRRLYVLLSKSLSFREPVLLVGDTGCGKTTVCQMLAAQQQQELYIINCHMHTEGADFLGGLRPVRNRADIDDDRLFEWVDGPLIHAMRNGGMFLADEISLADDSVLERLNSVLEPERTLVLAEKGSEFKGKTLETEVVVAHDNFRLIGTMNPGGDYGKKELSPAMRNRFTEVWCPKIEIRRSSSDVLNIVEHNIRKGLRMRSSKKRNNSGIGNAMLLFLQFFTKSELGERITISIRDIISWVNFINKVTSAAGGNMDVGLAYIHGACLVLLDGLGSGLSGTGLMGWSALRNVCINFLYQQVWELTGKQPDCTTLEEKYITGLKFIDEEERFGIGPFSIAKGKAGLLRDKSFTFVAPRTCINLVRVLRGLQLNRPVLLEGSPGVGKTSLVVALAKATNNDIVRINLSEQTDVSDLFGADLPVEGATGGKFAWRDGPLLQALRNGAWIVLDELNLASQSVLEGLNACFDHRGEIFVPELGQTFKVSHQNTKIFACQNPQHEGGARKGLPRSFLNRFTQVHIESLSAGDLRFILSKVHGHQIEQQTIARMVELNARLLDAAERGEWGAIGGPWQLNLRDLFRWCELLLQQNSNSSSRMDSRHRGIVDLLYAARLRTQQDRDYVHAVFDQVFADCPDALLPLEQPLLRLTEELVHVGSVSCPRLQQKQGSTITRRNLTVLQHQLPHLRQLMTCVEQQWLVLVVGSTGAGKSAVVQQLAALTGRQLHTVALTPQMDVGELLGGFQQVDHGRRLGGLTSAAGELVKSCVKKLLLESSGAAVATVTAESAVARFPLPPLANNTVPHAQQLLNSFRELIALRTKLSATERSSSDETRDFLHQCDLLHSLLYLTAATCINFSDTNTAAVDSSSSKLHEECCTLLQQVEELSGKVQQAATLASGGIFEWVDSPLVVAIREGHWVLVEGASLCAASVLDRLNPLLEPNGRLLLTERGVIDGSVPCVEPHQDFRIFLTIDHNFGEVSRAMRNRGVELFLSPLPLLATPSDDFTASSKDANNDDDSSSVDSGHSTDDGECSFSADAAPGRISICRSTTRIGIGRAAPATHARRLSPDLTALLVTRGVTCPRIQNTLVHVHRAVSDVLPVYIHPGVSVLLQAAELSVQLQQSGEEDVRALAIALHQGYVRCHGSHELQQQVQQVVQQVLHQSFVGGSSNNGGGNLLPLSSLTLQTRVLEQHGAQAMYVQQMLGYITCLLTADITESESATWMRESLPLVEPLPKLSVAAAEVLTLIVLDLPMNSWALLLLASKFVSSDGHTVDNEDVVAAIETLEAERKKGAFDTGVSLLVQGKDPLADPRHHFGSVLYSGNATAEQLASAANKLCIAVWRTLVNKQNTVETPLNDQQKLKKKTIDGHSLLDISKAINEKKINKNAAPHPCVPHLFPLLSQVDKFIKMLTATDDASVRISDELWQQLITALRWRDRLEKLCSQPVARQQFHVFLPKLILHWYFLNETLLKNIPSALSGCQDTFNKLQQTVEKLVCVFASNCGPVHDLAEDLSQHMNHPKAYSSKLAADAQAAIDKISTRLMPDLQDLQRNIFLATDAAGKAKANLLAIALDFQNGNASPSASLKNLKKLELFVEEAINKLSAKISSENTTEVQERKVCLLKIQSWPVIDYIVCHNICRFSVDSCNYNFSKDQLKELVGISMSIPLHLLEEGDGSSGWFSCLVSYLLTNTTASRDAVLWTNYSDDSNDADEEEQEIKRVGKVCSPVQCVLTQLLSAGTADEAMQQLKVGVHEEKAAQLSGIRATLWTHWSTLADPKFSPKITFRNNVTKFTHQLFESLSKTLNEEDAAASMSLQELVTLLSRCVHEKCGTTDLPLLFDELQSNIASITASSSTDVELVSVAKVGVAAGTLQGWIIAHLQAMDPAQKTKLMLYYTQQDADRLRQELLQHSWSNLLRGGQPVSHGTTDETQLTALPGDHPHLWLRQQELKSAVDSIATLSQQNAYRPVNVEYVRLTQDVAHFIQTAFNPSVIAEMISSLCHDDVTSLIADQIERKLITYDNFFNHIAKQYPLFKDVTALFLQGLMMATQSLRVLVSQTKMNLLNVVCNKNDVTKLLSKLCSFPLMRDASNPLKYLPHIRDDVQCLSAVLSTGENYQRSVKKCQSLALRIALLELHTASVTSGRLSEAAAHVLAMLVEKALHWWRKQEEEKKRKAEEEASLFKYKAQEHAKNETEEETIEREFAEMFPNYNKDFDDLNETNLDPMEVDEADVNPSSSADDTADDWLTERQLWEISEVHCDLLSKLPCSPLQKSISTAQSNTNIVNFGPVPAALQRVKILQTIVNSTGPVADCDLDRNTLGAYLIFNNVACKSLKDPLTTEILKKPDNFYVDPRPSEAKKLRPLLLPMLTRIYELLEQWPGHPSLVVITRVAERVLEYPVTAPLAKLLAGLESIYLKSEIWEANAPIALRLITHLQNIETQIVDWRKLELQEWKKCLDLVSHNESVASKMKWWPHLYDCITREDWNTADVGTLAVILKQLMEDSTLGDFESKLTLINAFNRHLLLSQSNVTCVIHVTSNIHKYYCQFLPIVKSTLDKERKLIETKVKETVKVANYNIATFRDISRVREKVTKCCQTLHYHMRKWKKVLMTQDRNVWAKDAGEELKNQTEGIWDAKSTTTVIASVVAAPAVLPTHDIEEASETSVLRTISSKTKKANKLVQQTVDSLPYNDCAEGIEDVTSAIITAYRKLSSDATQAGAHEDLNKEERLGKLKDVMKMRRVSVTRLFQQLNEMGIKYHRGNTLWTDDHLMQCYQLPTFDLDALNLTEATLKELQQLWPGCDKYYYRCINRYKLVQDRIAAPHLDIGPALVTRVKGVSKHLMLLIIDVRKEMSLFTHNLHTLKCYVDDLECAPTTPVASAVSATEIWSKLHSFSLSLSLTTAEVSAVLDTRPKEASFVPAANNSDTITLSAVKISEVKQKLMGLNTECVAIAQQSGQTLAAFSDEKWPRIVNEAHVELAGNLHQQLCGIAQTLTDVVTTIDAKREGYMCLTRELVSWLNTWSETEPVINQWLQKCSALQSSGDTDISQSNMTQLENCTKSVLFAVQCLYKKYENYNDDDYDSAGNTIITDSTVLSIISDIKAMKLNYVLKCVRDLVAQISDGENAKIQQNVTQLSSLLQQYLALGENLLLSAASGSRSIAKLLSVLLAIFYQLAINGFCKPQDLEEQQGGEGQLSFDDNDDPEAAGLAEGEGKKDMSDKFDSEDQLESALQENEQEKPGDKDLEEDDGVEMSNDFEGKHQDVDKPNPQEDDDDNNDDEDKNREDQMGQTEQGAETLDEKLWNDKEDERKDDGDLEEDDDATGNSNEMESQIVAKEKQKKNDKKNKDKEDEDKEQDNTANAEEKSDAPEEMEEDTRQPNQKTKDDDYDDEFEDERAGQDKKDDDPPADDALDIPDDLNMDQAEEEQKQDEKAEGDENEEQESNPPDIEKKSLFPEGKDLDSEEKEEEDMKDLPEEDPSKNEEQEDGEKNPDDMEGTDKQFDAEEVDGNENEEKESERNRNAGIDEDEDNKEDNAEETKEEEEKEKIEASKDRDAKTEAEAADIDASNASKDKTKDAPKTEEDSGAHHDKEEEQEECGESGEKTKETVGVGQSDAKQQDDDLHKGQESALTTNKDNTSQQQQEQQQQHKRRPGEIDEQKVTGDPEKDLKRGLLTSKNKELHKTPEEEEEMQDNNDNEEKKDEADKESNLWQVVKQAQDHHDGEVVDAGSREQAVEAPAPVQEDDAGEAQEEGVVQELMEVDETEEESTDPVPEKQAEDLSKSSREHKQGQKTTETTDDQTEEGEKIETEGDVVLEHTVQRPPETYFHTLLEDEKLTAEAQFDEDVAATRQRLQDSSTRLCRADVKSGHDWAVQQAKLAPYAAQLCDQLRLILEPTQAARLKGDYKTGKRLNMRKVIAYIASHFLKDKIWMRRTQPSKRTYHVLLAVDDSESMKTVQAEDLAKQSICLVAGALTKLEVGKVGVVSFGSSTTLLHSLDENFSDASGAKIFANLKFDQKESRFLDLLESTVAMFSQARGGTVAHSDTAQILIIISDGQTHARSEKIKAAVAAARNDRIFVVFFVLDAAANHSFYDIQVWNKEDNSLKPLAEQFPFPFYLVVRDLTKLPYVLAEALRRWFELVTADVSQ